MNDYETGFNEHRTAHPNAYTPNGYFQGEERVRIGSRAWAVPVLEALGMKRTTAMILYG